MMTYLVGSICTGYAGLEAGVIAALGGDAEVPWVADMEPGPSKILAHRLPGAENLGDITKIRWEDVPPVHVMCAGWPCQSASIAGKQKGVDDERWIWPQIAAGIGRMGAPPGMLVLENVTRLLTVSDGAAMAQVICSLAALGYVGRYGIYRADQAGACHQRKRLFFLAVHRSAAAHALGRELQRRGERGVLGGPQAPVAGDLDKRDTPQRQRERDGRPVGDSGEEAAAHTERQQLRAFQPGGVHGQEGQAEGERDQRERLWPDALDGSSDDLAGQIDWMEYEPAIRRWEAVTGIRAPHPVEPGKSGNVRLAAEFPEWMMGLPPGWVTGVPGLTRSQQLKAIGNGVVPHQAALAVQRLYEPVGELPSSP